MSRIFVDPVDLKDFHPTIEQPLPKELLDQWRVHGFAAVDNLLPESLIDAARNQLLGLIEKNRDKVIDDFGGFSFPFSQNGQALNDIVLHPILLALARQALGSEVALTQGEAWLKEPTPTRPEGNQDQRMHMDWPNHYLTHPSDFHHPEVLAMILYFDDSTVCGGETSLVAREGDDDPLYAMPYNKMPGTGRHPWINDRTTAEEYFKVEDPEIYEFRQKLYAKEKFLRFKKGTLLLYRLDVYHRGTPIKEGQTRMVMNVGYKIAACSWVTTWHRGWSYFMYDNLWGVIPLLNDDQKAALGIPRSSHPYWQEGCNASNVAARFKDQKPFPPI